MVALLPDKALCKGTGFGVQQLKDQADKLRIFINVAVFFVQPEIINIGLIPDYQRILINSQDRSELFFNAVETQRPFESINN